MARNTSSGSIALKNLLREIRSCRHCADSLPLGPRPVLRASSTARLLIVGQAPGTRVHASGVPWDDPSGDRLRQWLCMAPQQFYDESHVAIVPMGFCYPGRGKSGDLPPPPDCAPLWHARLLKHMPHPSPRNTLWLRRNPWFEQEVLPALRERLSQLWA